MGTIRTAALYNPKIGAKVGFREVIKMVHMTENELAQHGYAVMGEQALRVERTDLTIEQMAQLSDDELYAIGINRLQISERAHEQCLDLGRKAAAQRWWVGKVIGEIKKRKTRHWLLWLNTKNLGSKKTTIDDAISLSERMTLDRASELGLTDAMREAGVWEERKAKAASKDDASKAAEGEDAEDRGCDSAKEQDQPEPEAMPTGTDWQKPKPRPKKQTGRPRLHEPDDQADDGTENKPTKRTLPLLSSAQVSLALVAPGEFLVTLTADKAIHELYLSRQQLDDLYAAGCEETTIDDECEPDKLPDALAQ
jgi:hypothetical protein